MLKLFKVSYCVKHNDRPLVVKFIKAETKVDAINVGIPYEKNGSPKNIDKIKVKYLCDVDEIMNVTSARGEK